ncbi:MAG TPA: SpvB/TcaC N-terminal domain-containing protein, partial [Candidatus Polarisedimenticolia bacterium]|nr:SpvB/TcaC N-terminal domain-containing protein [Candidatus Polarisedimenticolia bacterium]
MPESRNCLVWGEGPEQPACLGAATPVVPAPLPDPSPFRRAAASSRRRRGAPLGPGGRALLMLLALLAGTTGRAARASDADPFGAGVLTAIGAPTADPVTGLATALVPLEVPPGRHGLAPALALRYSSAGGLGNAGLGFDLAVGSIERSTRLGPPRFDDTDTFVLNIDGASWDLVPQDAGSTRFRTVLASGWLVERVRPGPWGLSSTQFVARDRDGRRFRFGSAGGSASTSQVADFKWGLDRVEDTSGNVMEIAWAASGRRLYPVRIEYASHPATGLPATNVVELCWEERGDRIVSASGETFTHRLRQVRTSAGMLPARVFTFTYGSIGSLTAPLGTCRFDVAPSGPVNSVPGPTTNPGPAQPPSAPRIAPAESESPVASPPPTLTKIGKVSPAPGAAPAPVPVAPLGDDPGIVTDDVVAPPTSLPPVPSLLVRIDRADGTGAMLPSIDYTYGVTGQPAWPSAGSAGLIPPAPFLYVKADADEDAGARLVDLNRDGLPDLAQFEGRLSGFSASTTAAVWLNTGPSFQYSAAWSAALLQLVQPSDASRSPWFVIKRDTRDRVENGVRFVDVNDDGRVDILRSVIWFGTGVRKQLFLNTGSGFTGDVA